MLRSIKLGSRTRLVVWVAIGLVLLGIAGIGLAWSIIDWSPPRARIPRLTLSMSQGFTPDGRSLLTQNAEGMVFWDSTTWQPRRPWSLLAFKIHDFATDGLTCVGEHGYDAESAEVAWVDVESGAIRAKFACRLPRVVHLSFIDEGRSIRAFLTNRSATVCEVVTWDIASGAEARHPIFGPASPGVLRNWPLAYSADGRVLAYLNLELDGIQLWDADTDQPIGSLLRTPTTKLVINSTVAMTPDETRLLVSRADGQIEVWSLANRRHLRTIPAQPAGSIPKTLVVAPDGRTVASTAFQPPDSSWVANLTTAAQPQLGLSRTNSLVEQTILVDLTNGKRLAVWPGSSSPVFSPDARTVVTLESQSDTFSIRDVPRP